MRLVAAVLFAALPFAAAAQPITCNVPVQVERPRPDLADTRVGRRLLPTASYTLAISWSPQFCKEHDTSSFQCEAGSRFGFVLHGLWPDGAGKEWPQYCRPVELLPESTIRTNLCATPSAQLQQHEWAKHGSCMNVTANDYFRRSTGLFGRLRFPDMEAMSRRSGLSAGAVASALARANPGIAPNMVRITVTRGGWLDEIWLCLDLQLRYARCSRAQDGGLPASARVKIWRDER